MSWRPAFLFILLLPIQAVHASILPDLSCIYGLKKKIADTNSEIFRKYKQLSPKGPGLKLENESQLFIGHDEEAIILVHGFLASPFEVLQLAEHLNKKGRTTYLPLIFGFGSDSTVAANATLENWKDTIQNSVDLMKGCFSKISIVGFSLGGGLSMHYVLTKSPPEVNSLTLLSPYLQPSAWYGKMLNGLLSSFIDEISLTRLFSLSGHPDLVIPLQFPDFYNDSMSMGAVKTIYQLRDEIEELPAAELSSVPVFLGYSEADETINYKFAKEFISDHFSSIQYWVSPKDAKIPHQITIPSKTYDANPLFESVYDFLKQKSLPFQTNIN